MSRRLPTAIRALRERKTPPWTQADLARRVGTTPSRIGAYERGDMVPDLARAMDVANALGARVEVVFYAHFEESCTRHGGLLQGLDGSPSSEPP